MGQVYRFRGTQAAPGPGALAKRGLFTRALVETDAGFYALQEGASLRKGELVTLRERRDGSRSLCDLEGRCTGLLGVLR